MECLAMNYDDITIEDTRRIMKKYHKLTEQKSKIIMQQFSPVEIRELTSRDGKEFEDYFMQLYQKCDDIAFIAQLENPD